MYSTEILSLSRSRKDILDGAGAILTKAKAENRGLNDSERQEFDRRHAEGMTMLADIERLQAQAAEEERQKQLLPDSRQGGTGKLDGSPEEREAATRETFRTYLRRGVSGLSADQQAHLTAIPETRALSDITGAQGAFTVPQGFEKDLVIATLAYGPFLKYVDTVETPVIDRKQTALLQVGKDDPPTAAQVGQGAKKQITLERLLIALADGRDRRLLTTVCEVTERERQRLENGFADVCIRQEIVARGGQRLADTRPHLHDLHEVVEMTGLERGILPIIRKTQEFLIFRRITRIMQPVENREGCDGC